MMVLNLDAASGQLVSQTATGQKPSTDISLFKPNRLNKGAYVNRTSLFIDIILFFDQTTFVAAFFSI